MVLCFESCLSFETYNPRAGKDYESNYRFEKIAHSVISCLLCSGDSYDDVDRGIWDIQLLHGFGERLLQTNNEAKITWG